MKNFEKRLLNRGYPTSILEMHFSNNSVNVPINPFPAEWVLRALIDFTLSNVRRIYSSMGNPLDGKGLKSNSVTEKRHLNKIPGMHVQEYCPL